MPGFQSVKIKPPSCSARHCRSPQTVEIRMTGGHPRADERIRVCGRHKAWGRAELAMDSNEWYAYDQRVAESMERGRQAAIARNAAWPDGPGMGLQFGPGVPAHIREHFAARVVIDERG